MSTSYVSGVSSHSSTNNTAQLLKQEFQQVGKDLKAGNLAAAQADFVRLSSTAAKNAKPNSQVGANIRQQFGQLAGDLRRGDFSDAQQAYTRIQQTFATLAHNHGGDSVQGESQKASAAAAPPSGSLSVIA